jgi:hypothetical protein
VKSISSLRLDPFGDGLGHTGYSVKRLIASLTAATS